MKNRIFDYIQDIDDTKKAFIDENTLYSYGDIKSIYKKNSSTLKTLQNQQIYIQNQNRTKLALLLCLLDGVASSILLYADGVEEDITSYHKVELNEDNIIIVHRSTCKSIKTDITEHTQWLISTSGTTATPKLITHTLHSLTRTLQLNSKRSFQLALTFDIFRFSGLQLFLQSTLSGSTLLIPTNLQKIDDSLKFFAKHKCNHISATPSFFRKLLMSKHSKDLNLHSITLGGEIVDEQILQSLKTHYPKTKLRHIYASTEVGVGFCVDDERAGFSKELLHVSKDIELKINSNSILLLKPKGCEYFTNSGDEVEARGDRVYFIGRESGAINVGGNKVQPSEVESALMSSKLISLVRVYAKKSPILGELVYADVVSNKSLDDKQLKKALLVHVKNSLEKFKQPAIIKIVDDIILNNNSKIDRGV